MKVSKKNKKIKSKIEKFESLQVINPNAAGIDIGSKSHWVCVPEKCAQPHYREFPTFTNNLYQIADWLSECGVTTVAMESTSVYWIPLYDILESKGFDVNLVNSSQTKSVPGRPKTDIVDCQWIYRLHSYGLLRSSFRPKDSIRKIRTITRHRENLIRMKAKHVQHIQKALDLMNIKLHFVISDITGITGRNIIKDILNGNHNPQKLANLKNFRIKASKEEIAESLVGNYQEEHLFNLQLAFDALEFTEKQILQVDRKVEKFLDQIHILNDAPQLLFDFDSDPDQQEPLRKKDYRATKNAPDYNVKHYLQNIIHVNLMEVPGIQDNALTIISEIGTDMTKWHSAQHFTSWLSLSPRKKSSGGRTLSQNTRKVRSPANKAFRNAASTLRNSKTYLGAFFRKIQSRSSFACAVTATASKLAKIVYHMIKNRTSFYDLGQDYLLKRRENQILKNMKKNASKLGYAITVTKIS